MNIKGILGLGAVAMGVCALPSLAGELDITDGAWKITFNASNKTLTYAQNGKTILKNVYISALNGAEETLESKNYPTVKLTQTALSDVIGTGTKYTYTYSGLSGKDNIEQSFYIYADKGYMLVDAALVANGGTTKSHYIAPIVCTTSNTFLPSSGQNVVYDMPHDNDNWVGYSAQPWNMGQLNVSCEVSAFYDVQSREGLIVGSVEHDNWKSGISATPNGSNRLRNLTVAAGVVNERTNDVNTVNPDRPSLTKHGSISGARVVSPKYFFGYYADWRRGLEALGEATEKFCPKLPWNGGTIFAWQSWGGMADKVNYEGAVDVSDFFHEQLQPNNFHNENGVQYMVLDSYWDNFSEDQLRRFAEHCKANGQHPGIYTTPFSYWGDETSAATDRPYSGSPYTWADMSLKANGKLRKIASIALDPTHPGTIEWNRQRFEMFKKCGFEYVKLDFINNGTLEADDFYADGVTTGMQAYTYGMDKVLEQADGMFVDLSIAPVFPAKGHARRISCDAWGEMSNSQYSLNSIELGWWLDRVYCYNDPDHLVLSRAENEGAARVRYTCGAITGTVLLGDNYSLKGSYLGKQSERDLALKVATNADVNAVAQLGRSFYPVEGSMTEAAFSRWQYNYTVDSEFMLDTDKALYYVVFNYDMSNAKSKDAMFARLGINASEVKNITELWTGEKVAMSADGFKVSIPKSDVRIYRLEKEGWSSSISDIKDDGRQIEVSVNSGSLDVKAPEPISAVSVYAVDGTRMAMVEGVDGESETSLAVGYFTSGIYVIHVVLESGRTFSDKFLLN